MADKQNPNHHGRDTVLLVLEVSANPVVSPLLARAFAPELCDLIWSFNFTTTTVTSMDAKSSDLDDWTS